MAYIKSSFYSTSLKKNADFIAFIPSISADDYLSENHIDYNRKEMKFQTLYLLHGSYGDCTDWTFFSNIIRYAQDKKIAVIMPSAENSNYFNMCKGEPYLTYISEELPKFASRIFPLSRKRANTFIGGLSMGGYGTFRIAFEHPEIFSHAASLSGVLDISAIQNSTKAHFALIPKNYRDAVWADNQKIHGSRDDLSFLLEELMKEGTQIPSLYMTCGTEDFLFPDNLAFYSKAATLGAEIIFDKHPGVHNWDYWDSHIQDVLNWLPTIGDMVPE